MILSNMKYYVAIVLGSIRNTTSIDISERNRIRLENRKVQVTLTRMRIGHTYSTHSYLTTKNEPEKCDACKVSLSIKHILTAYTKYTINRNKHEIGTDLKQMLTDPDTLMCSHSSKTLESDN